MEFFSWITEPDAWVALLTLTVLEIVLGIDNIVFISILAGRLPQEQQARARSIGLGAALVMRIAAAAHDLLDHRPDAAVLHDRRLRVLRP